MREARIHETRVERLLIVGGGIAGLTLAASLRRRGIIAEIVERAAGWTTCGAGLYLVGNGTRALAQLGLLEAVLPSCRLIRTQTLLNHRGSRLARIDVHAFWAACGPCVSVPRTALHSVLANAVAGLPIRFGLTVESLRQRETHVEVDFSDGTSDRYDFVVGADGIRSIVRQLEVGAGEPVFRGQLGWRFLADCPPGIDGWTVFLGGGKAFLLVPIGGERAYCYADVAARAPADDPCDTRIARLRRIFADFARPVREVLEQIENAERVHFGPIEESRASPQGRGRVLLIGDAAHAMSPNMACGAALAFEDALVLTDVINREAAVQGIVPEFVRRRADRVAWVRAQTHRRDRMRGLPSIVRDLYLRAMGSRMYAANYGPLLARP